MPWQGSLAPRCARAREHLPRHGSPSPAFLSGHYSYSILQSRDIISSIYRAPEDKWQYLDIAING